MPQALGHCYVFIDQADQALGRRDAGQNNSGIWREQPDVRPRKPCVSRLSDYQNPVPLQVLETQIRFAACEASDLEFVPACFRPK